MSDYSTGFTLHDLDAIINQIKALPKQEFHITMGFDMAWRVGGKKFNYGTVRKNKRLRLVKHKYIGAMPTTKYLK